jgi:hypothetical protein
LAEAVTGIAARPLSIVIAIAVIKKISRFMGPPSGLRRCFSSAICFHFNRGASIKRQERF